MWRRRIGSFTAIDSVSATIELIRPSLNARKAPQHVLRHALVAIGLAALIIAAGPISNNSLTPATIVVQPAAVTITVPSTTAPAIPVDPPEPASAPSRTAAGDNTAVLPMAVHVQVLPGKAQWLADATLAPATDGDTRILSGKVLYAVGDNQVWQLVARVTGADGHQATPECSSAYLQIPGDTSTVVTGGTVTVGDLPMVVCAGSPGHSGGIFNADLELEGHVSGSITVSVELLF